MKKELLWSKDRSRVYGWEEDFSSKEDFANEIKSVERGCQIRSVSKDMCVCGKKGLKFGNVNLLKLAGVSIKALYVADVSVVA